MQKLEFLLIRSQNHTLMRNACVLNKALFNMDSLFDLGGYKVGGISEAIGTNSVSQGEEHEKGAHAKKESLTSLFDKAYREMRSSTDGLSELEASKVQKREKHLKDNSFGQEERSALKEHDQQQMKKSSSKRKTVQEDPKNKVKRSKITKAELDDNENDTKSISEPARLERTIFVGNVPVTSSRKTLKKLFLKYGKIETVRIRSAPVSNTKTAKKVAVIKKEFHDDRHSFNAYIVFQEKKSCTAALQSNGEEFGGLHLRVDLATKPEPDHKRSIFVGNLPFNTEEEELRKHFEDCGDVESVRIIRDKTTGLGKGFGYILFKKVDGVTFGLKMNGSEFKARKIRVHHSVNKSKIPKKSKFRERRFGGLKGTSKGNKLKSHQKSSGKKTSKNKQNALKRIKNKKNLNKRKKS